jgi:hypothetical protein
MLQEIDKVQDESATKPDGITREIVTAKDRVKKFRAKLKAEQCGRFEVCIGLDVIEGVRELAKRKNVSTWEVVEDALKAALATPPRSK